MLKTIRSIAVGAIAALCLIASPAFAEIGQQPGNGFALVDGNWLNGLAAGHNQTYQSGISAAGTTQATATQLPDRIMQISVDTVASSTGVNLPMCLAGTEVLLYNNGAQTLAVYPTVKNNIRTGAQDTINNATSFSGGIATHVSGIFFCPKDGVWAAK